jgi:hypothetical protein
MSRCRVLLRYRGALAIAGAVLLSVGLSGAAPEAGKFETILGPTPITDTTKLTITGKGAANATLDGNKLTVSGTFDGLTTPATDAHLMLGVGIGVPGSSIADLTVSQAQSGTVSGTVTLSRTQVAAFKDGNVYVQIDSQKAPAPIGNLWGWFLPEHEKVGQDVPQEGDWFLPQGRGLKAHPTPPNQRNQNENRV